MRAFWIGFGILAQLLFAVTVCRLFLFLQGTSRGLLASSVAGFLPWYGLDLLLAVQFALLHSLLLAPAVRRRCKPVIPPPQYGCFFCLTACGSLLLAIELWQPSATVLWQLTGPAALAVSAAFLLTWAALIYSLSLTGLGWQTGWTPWWAWLRGRPLERTWTEPPGAYRLLRHPIYLSFLGLLWLVPCLTLDRLLLAGLWTVYLFLGSYWKDRRLLYYVGDAYRRYQARVPGYPFVPFGPLGKVPVRAPETACRKRK
jgi:protein-S-isoprenylcysteine O-methyltransferase Ste14